MTLAMGQGESDVGASDVGARASSVAVERSEAGKPLDVIRAKAAVQEQLGLRAEMLEYAGKGQFDLRVPHSGSTLSAFVEVVVTDGNYMARELYN